MFACLLRRLGPTWQTFLRSVLPALLAALGIVGIKGLITGDWSAAQLAALAIVAVGATVLASMILAELIICAAGQGIPSSTVPAGTSAPGGSVDCPTAKAVLADAQARVARAEADLAAKTAHVRALQDVVNNSRMALTLALCAVTASALFPWLLPIALTAAATAALVLWGTAKALATAVADMNSAALALGAAIRDAAAAEAMVAQACSVVVTPTPPRPTVTLGSLTVLAGVH